MGVANASPSTPARGCQPPVLGPPPAVASHAADGWRGLTVLRPARTPSASRGCACAAPLVVAACCTPTNFCTSFSLHDRAQQEPSAAPPALQALVYQSLQAAALSTLASVFKRRSALQAAALSTLASVFKQRSAVLPEQPQPGRRPAPSPPSWPCPAARAGGLQPLRPRARGSAGARGRGARQRGAQAARGKGRLNFLLCCRCCQAPLCMFFSSILDTVAPGLDCSGAFLGCGDLASRTTSCPCGLSRPSTVSRCVLSARSHLRLCLALRVRSPPCMPLEDARDRTTRGE